MRPIEIDGVFAAFARREVPDGNPRQPHREGRTGGADYRNEHDVQRNVHREADEQDAKAFLDLSRSRHDLGIDLEEVNTRNGADQARIRPDSSDFDPKNATAKSVQNSPRARLAGMAATAKYLVKNFRIEKSVPIARLPKVQKPRETGIL